MRTAQHAQGGGFRLTLPATSANLGPGFDAVGLALSLNLTVDAHAAEKFAIAATGRDAAVCGALDNNLIIASYCAALTAANRPPVPLSLQVDNEIPLGMGCGSSAAARLAGVALANHFGGLQWADEQVVAMASIMEGHPDNIAACWYGGFTVSVPHGQEVSRATFACDGTWQLLLALPETGLATERARGVLPSAYSREDAVFNVQRAALLTAAFAQERLDLLAVAMQDRLHQPQRRQVCGLLEHLDALRETEMFAGVALSGAGPALLAILGERTSPSKAEDTLRTVMGEAVELIPVRIAGGVERSFLP